MKISAAPSLLLLLLLLAGCGQPTDQPIEKSVPLDAIPRNLVQVISSYPGAKVDSATEYSGMTGSGYIVKFHDDHGYYTLQFNRLLH
ncbi:MAG TPA: hypothetical protein VGP99_04685 [Tepidisphaeraceae bacterium]|jgi:hypothetical protein|nr:hypothetical protein [Tepidisphaeraceae bacterium]